MMSPVAPISYQDGVGLMPAGMGTTDGDGNLIPYEFAVAGAGVLTAWLGDDRRGTG